MGLDISDNMVNRYITLRNGQIKHKGEKIGYYRRIDGWYIATMTGEIERFGMADTLNGLRKIVKGKLSYLYPKAKSKTSN